MVHGTWYATTEEDLSGGEVEGEVLMMRCFERLP